MSTMGEHLYSTHSGRLHHHAQDLTPYSAVSSFNFPAHCDSSLITPVSISQSPSMPTKPPPILRRDPEIKLSPSTLSPNYQLFCTDDEFEASKFHNSPMKLKDPSATLHISTADKDISFPQSPFMCSTPYYGSFGVSATPQSGRTSNSSPSINRSPHVQSAGGISNDSRRSRQQTPAQSATSYPGNSQAPILIAPNPLSLRPAKQESGPPYRQNSLQSNQSTPQSQGPPQGQFPDQPLPSLPPRRKRKTPPTDYDSETALDGKCNFEEKVLLQLKEEQGLSWKEVAAKFNERTGKEMKVPALQMKKKRLRERLRVWTDVDEKALTLSWEDYDKRKWQTIADDMRKYGCREKWTKEACQKKWGELYPEDAPYIPEYEMVERNRNMISQDIKMERGATSWSDGRDSGNQSMYEGEPGTLMSAISTTTMDEVRSRAASDASSQMQLHHQQQQQQMMFDHQQHRHQQQNVWGSGA